MPVTTVFSGPFGRMGQRFYHRIAREGTLARALIARLRLVERIALTPEGIPAERACRAIDIAIGLGLPVLNFSFHSPSLRPGNTPYVRSAADLDLFRSEEHTSELQSLMRISYAVFCLKKKHIY